jgi:hypothetical protein
LNRSHPLPRRGLLVLQGVLGLTNHPPPLPLPATVGPRETLWALVAPKSLVGSWGLNPQRFQPSWRNEVHRHLPRPVRAVWLGARGYPGGCPRAGGEVRAEQAWLRNKARCSWLHLVEPNGVAKRAGVAKWSTGHHGHQGHHRSTGATGPLVSTGTTGYHGHQSPLSAGRWAPRAPRKILQHLPLSRARTNGVAKWSSAG